MKLRLKRNRKYIAVLIGGYPVDIDKVMELVANKQQRISFIYGFGLFVIYFYSQKSTEDIQNIFLTTLKDEVDMFFVFRNTRHAIQHLVPNLKVRIETARDERTNIAGADINALRETIRVIGHQMSAARFSPPMNQQAPPPQSDNEVAVSDDEILNELLMKMKATGYGSLTPAELDFLQGYKDKHRKDKTNDNDVD